MFKNNINKANYLKQLNGCWDERSIMQSGRKINYANINKAKNNK
jgi:hypothetical protein